MIYPTKKKQELRGSRSKTSLSVQDEIKDTIVHQLSAPREVKKSLKSLPREIKKSLKSLPRGVEKAANSIKHCKTTADSVPEWLNLDRKYFPLFKILPCYEGFLVTYFLPLLLEYCAENILIFLSCRMRFHVPLAIHNR